MFYKHAFLVKVNSLKHKVKDIKSKCLFVNKDMLDSSFVTDVFDYL